jgi:TM2 domain-containing membrane protein YozV
VFTATPPATVGAVPGAGAGAPVLQPIYVAPPAAPPVSTNRIAAGVCAILIGSLGIHKFVLGYTGAGLIMLLLTVLTCGLAGGVMHIIGIIEGIIYLTKTDAEFHQIYEVGRKEWF